MITEQQKIARMASIMAVSNLGQLHNLKLDQVTDLKRSPPAQRASYDVLQIAGHLIESDDHESYFGDEAEGWETQIRKAGVEAFINQFSHHRETLEKVWNA